MICFHSAKLTINSATYQKDSAFNLVSILKKKSYPSTFAFELTTNIFVMRKIILGTLSILFMVTTSQTFGQNSQRLTIENTTEQENLTGYENNKKTAIAVSNAILQADWETLDKLLDDDFTYTGDGFVFKKDEYIGFMQDMRAAFTDFNMILTHTVVDGNKVSVRFISKVVNTGKFMGAPANKKNLEVSGIFIRKVKDGKVYQEWQTTDLLGVMNKIGFGAMFPYAIFVTGFGASNPPSVRKPNDFLSIDGDVENFENLTTKEKKKYLKEYLKNFDKKSKS